MVGVTTGESGAEEEKGEEGERKEEELSRISEPQRKHRTKETHCNSHWRAAMGSNFTGKGDEEKINFKVLNSVEISDMEECVLCSTL